MSSPVEFKNITEKDLPRIEDWIDHDFFHFQKMAADWWIGGADCVLSCRVDDHEGPVMYMKADKEKELVRLHVQFAPESVVSKRRVIHAILDGFPRFVWVMKTFPIKGIIFESVNDLLISFMKKKLSFASCGGDDYLLQFQET